MEEEGKGGEGTEEEGTEEEGKGEGGREGWEGMKEEQQQT